MIPTEQDKEKVRRIQAVVLDFDGTLTDNCELIGFGEAMVKGRSHSDGQGISLLRDIGLRIAIATNEIEESAIVARYLVRKWNNLPSTKARENPWPPINIFCGVGHISKWEAVRGWLDGLSIDPAYCAAMGDDLVDWPLLQQVGYRAAPVTAETVIKEIADFVSDREAGHGAVRDFANFILACRGIDQTKLRPF